MSVCRYCGKRYNKHVPCDFTRYGKLYRCHYKYTGKALPFFKCNHVYDYISGRVCDGRVNQSRLLCFRHLNTVNTVPDVNKAMSYSRLEISPKLYKKRVCRECFKLTTKDTPCSIKVNNKVCYCRYGDSQSRPYYKCNIDGCSHPVDMRSIICGKHK